MTTKSVTATAQLHSHHRLRFFPSPASNLATIKPSSADSVQHGHARGGGHVERIRHAASPLHGGPVITR